MTGSSVVGRTGIKGRGLADALPGYGAPPARLSPFPGGAGKP